MNTEQVARVAHEVNKSYCDALGDFSQESWDKTPDWQKKSAIEGVLYHKENPNCAPEDSHNSWLVGKEKEGWKYGEIKDVIKKEHPCFLPYEELPAYQKVKDYLFLTIVRELLS